MNRLQNVFASIPDRLSAELAETLSESKHARIERIVSHGHASPEGFWYDQPQCEWVVVLKGAARLRFENQANAIELKIGDAIEIPAQSRHCVEWTTPDEPTVWLAVHFDR
jgi:cupin 2 domain-containing protein